MRELRAILLTALALVAVSSAAWGKWPKSYIVGSAHDLTSRGTPKEPETSVCYFCHIMHKTGGTGGGTLTTVPGAYLWNHTLSAMASYGTYSSDSFNSLLSAAGETVTDLGGATVSSLATSNLCLSCHDQTVAFGSFYQTSPLLPTTLTSKMAATLTITDMTRQHPVHFPYTATLSTDYGSNGLVSPAVPGRCVDVGCEIPLYAQNAAASGATADAGYLECTTCHDVHNGNYKTNGQFPFNRNFSVAVTSGPFCTACHM